jgi:hypothetical protein
MNTSIPIGHSRGDENGLGCRKGAQGFSEGFRGEAKTEEPAGDPAQGRWLCHLFSIKVSAVIWSSLGFFDAEGLKGRVANVETVDIVDGPAIFLEKGSEIEKPQGLGPEIIGREVVNPRVD